ncbi:MAG: N-acetyltransferase [Nevskia sp.]|nr:N-acetyltransferase [Nevskia sp.]
MLRIFRATVLPPAFEFELAGGLRALLRPIRADDAPRFERGYEQLSEASRRTRFFGQASALSQTQLHFLTEVDQVNHAAWGALNLLQPQEPGIGVARYIRVDRKSDAAEVAITVLDAYQHRGAGALLHACLHLTAARHGLRRFLYDVSQDNQRFIAHLKAIGALQTGSAEHILRLEMPVYARASKLPRNTASGQHFAALMRRLQHVPAVDA